MISHDDFAAMLRTTVPAIPCELRVGAVNGEGGKWIPAFSVGDAHWYEADGGWRCTSSRNAETRPRAVEPT